LSGTLHAFAVPYRAITARDDRKKEMALDPSVCEALVDALVSARVLRRTLSGNYIANGPVH
jgi:hypothetical protein